MSDGRDLVSGTVVARELGVSYQTINLWARQGKLTPASRTPGGHYRWDMADVRRQLGMGLEATLLDPVRAAFDEARSGIAKVGDPDAAFALASKLADLMLSLTERAGDLKHNQVQRVADARRMDLAPLAERISMSSARRARRDKGSR